LMLDSIALLNNSATYQDVFISRLQCCSAACSSDFYLVPDTTTAHHYWGISQSTGTPPLSYIWSWGDGTYDSIAYPSHTYATAGYYTICLSIEDSTGCFDSICIPYSIQKLSAENTIVKVDIVDSISGAPTSVQHASLLQSVSIFPNPASQNA